jgi:hypothetical protein
VNINVRDETQTVSEGLNRVDMAASDMEIPRTPVLKTLEEQPDKSLLEVHSQHQPHDHAHVDLMKEEYLPDEVARMLGTSVEVVMHAIWHGELKARRSGHQVVYISRAALIEWYKDRS